MKTTDQQNTTGSENSPNKRQIKGGYKRLTHKDGKAFSKENQPDPKLKAEGWKKRKFSRLVIADMLNMKYKFTPASFKEGVAKQLKDAFGDLIDEMTIGELMTAQQVQKAILKGDGMSYQAILNQAMGLPKQDVDISSMGEKIGEVDYTKLSDKVLEAILNASSKGKE